ncbi:S-adenosyl-L-methionine-dependent methyltransferase [Morchella snyderi]|nr:S-adenosyl-L-methionine-dependent methyltransferase [Morchella snyderi]
MAESTNANAASAALPDLDVDSGNTTDDYSVYSSGVESATTSLKSSVLKYKYEHGRRYHAYKEGSYYGPNDETQNEQLDIFHHYCTLTMGGKLHFAPIGDNPQKILDIGTGTGIWAIDCADTYPSAQVIGNDLSPIQPSWVPPNLQFEIDDLESEWAIPRDDFDFIHMRYMLACVSDWPALFQKVYTTTKPGGYFESQEPTLQIFSDDGTFTRGSPIDIWVDKMAEAAEKFGKPAHVAHRTKAWMAEAGFEDVHEKVIKMPLGPWAKDPKMKDIGKYALLSALTGLEGFTMALFTRILGWTNEEVLALCEKCREQLIDRKVHMYQNYHVVYGRKPEKDEE